MKEENLIFIVSQPRSGSTFLQNILSNNFETNTCSEPWLLLNFANQFAPTLFKAEFDNKLTKEAFSEYLKKYSEIDINARQKQFMLDLYDPMAAGFNFVVDKTPRYWEILDEIHSLFPKSKIVLLKRNPVEVARSIILTWEIDSLRKMSYYKRDLLLAPKRIHTFNDKNKNSHNIYCIRYEDLLLDKEHEVKKLYEWIGISYNKSVLDIRSNMKYKGRFGDPFQNSEMGYIKAKAEANDRKLSKRDENFLKGYSHYLGRDFLRNYGGYEYRKDSKRTLSFSHFLHICQNKNENYYFKKELKYLLKESLYRMFN